MTHQIFNLPPQQPLSAAGRVLPGSKLYSYVTGTSTPTPMYTTSALSVAHANPLIADAGGRFSTAYMDPSIVYKITVTDANDVLLYTIDPANDQVLSAASVGAVLYPRSVAEIAAGATPVYYNYPWGDARRFVAFAGGDDTSGLQAWVSVPGYHYFPPATANTTGTLTMDSNSIFEFANGGTIQTATNNITLMYATGKSNITIRGAKFKRTSVGATPYIADVYTLNCTNVTIEECEFDGSQWAGVFLSSTSKSRVAKNYHHDFLGSGSDCCEIVVYEASCDNVVENNILTGGTSVWHGILVQEPYTTNLPKRNTIRGNKVSGTHIAGGILGYFPNSVTALGTPTTANTFNQFLDNDIEGVTGSASTTLYGSGLYIVGYGACGTRVSGNNIRNCCISTTAQVNGQSGLAIGGLPSTGAPVVVTNNTVTGMTKYYAINLYSNEGVQVIASGNAVDHPTGNTTGHAVNIEASVNTTFDANSITVSTASGRRGILIHANTNPLTNVRVTNNTVVGGGDRGIESMATSGGTLARITVSGNTVSGVASSIVPIYLKSIDQGSVVGNICSATSTYAMYVDSCTKLRGTANVLETTGTQAIGSTGTCTGSYFDESNAYDGHIENSATGMGFAQRATAAPSSGSSTGAIGDQAINSAPSAAGTPGWVCTTAGSPGTWKDRAAVAA